MSWRSIIQGMGDGPVGVPCRCLEQVNLIKCFLTSEPSLAVVEIAVPFDNSYVGLATDESEKFS